MADNRLKTLMGPMSASVKSVILTVRRSLPVFPNKLTFSKSFGMSQGCHEQISHVSNERGRLRRRPTTEPYWNWS